MSLSRISLIGTRRNNGGWRRQKAWKTGLLKNLPASAGYYHARFTRVLSCALPARIRTHTHTHTQRGRDARSPQPSFLSRLKVRLLSYARYFSKRCSSRASCANAHGIGTPSAPFLLEREPRLGFRSRSRFKNSASRPSVRSALRDR